jgi:hypothetical protein
VRYVAQAIVCLVVFAAANISAQDKRNSRTPPKDLTAVQKGQPAVTPTYIYEFDRPGFIYPNVRIEHDESGRGMISFKRDGYEGSIDDPILLSQRTLETLNKAFSALDFVNSSEEYQTKLDHSNMGNVSITRRTAGKERTAKFNWTDNKDAKLVMDEYRRISNEYTWRFEMLSSRQNQPLLSPGLVDSFDRYLQRSEISDPPHMLPFLTELSTDERLPLMARNHLTKLIRSIEKTAKK